MTGNNTADSSASGFLIEEYEGLSRVFVDVEQMPSTGYCDLYRAKRFGRWYLLKCLRPEHQGDEAYRQMLGEAETEVMRIIEADEGSDDDITLGL